MTPDELRDIVRRNPDLSLAEHAVLREAAASARLDRSERGQTHVVEAAEVPSASEHDEQVALFQYIDRRANQDPAWKLIFAIPNGGYRHKAVAAKMKAEGVRAGVPDIFVATPRGRYHGAFIEMKAGRNTTTAHQRMWLDRLEKQGYYTAVCYGCNAAIEQIENYLSMGRRALGVQDD